MSGSLALLADAGHMLSDAAGVFIALLAAWIAARPASDQRTYSYQRAEVLAALERPPTRSTNHTSTPEIRGTGPALPAGGHLQESTSLVTNRPYASAPNTAT